VTLSSVNLADIETTLKTKNLIPASCLAIFVGGSLARGWQHARSDADLYVVSTEPWTGEADGFNAVALDPATVPTNSSYLDGRRIEVRYWTDDQIDQLLGKVTWERFRETDSIGDRINKAESYLLARLSTALVVSGVDWIDRRREQLADSAFRPMLTMRALAVADSYVEDALGMLESGDQHAAILAAHGALVAAADALAANQGELGVEDKWRARRMAAISSPVLPFDRYWELTTMRSYDPEQPKRWVEDVLELCRTVALEVEI